MTDTYQLHGLRIRSELPIPAPTVAGDAPDVEVRWGRRRPISHTAPAGQLLAQLPGPGGGSSASQDDGGYTVRLHGLCDFRFDRPLRRVDVHLAPEAPRELGSVLLGGALSTLLTLRGHCVLHASAVQMDEGVAGFVGMSGSGKTTLAALCCAAGAGLVSDDVLRVESAGDSAWCYSGSGELRLRPTAAELAEALDGDGEPTADGRLAVRPRRGKSGRLPLTAVIAPVCVHGGERLEIERLRGPQAVLELIRHPHASGWVDGETVRRDFQMLAMLATSLPVYRARVPWGPPFSPSWAEMLLEALHPQGGRVGPGAA